jgi:hypothetical protein
MWDEPSGFMDKRLDVKPGKVFGKALSTGGRGAGQGPTAWLSLVRYLQGLGGGEDVGGRLRRDLRAAVAAALNAAAPAVAAAVAAGACDGSYPDAAARGVF